MADPFWYEACSIQIQHVNTHIVHYIQYPFEPFMTQSRNEPEQPRTVLATLSLLGSVLAYYNLTALLERLEKEQVTEANTSPISMSLVDSPCFQKLPQASPIENQTIEFLE